MLPVLPLKYKVLPKKSVSSKKECYLYNYVCYLCYLENIKCYLKTDEEGEWHGGEHQYPGKSCEDPAAGPDAVV